MCRRCRRSAPADSARDVDVAETARVRRSARPAAAARGRAWSCRSRIRRPARAFRRDGCRATRRRRFARRWPLASPSPPAVDPRAPQPEVRPADCGCDTSGVAHAAVRRSCRCRRCHAPAPRSTRLGEVAQRMMPRRQLDERRELSRQMVCGAIAARRERTAGRQMRHVGRQAGNLIRAPPRFVGRDSAPTAAAPACRDCPAGRRAPRSARSRRPCRRTSRRRGRSCRRRRRGRA